MVKWKGNARPRWKLRSIIKYAWTSYYFCVSLNDRQKNFYCDTMLHSRRNLSPLCTGWMLADGAIRFIYKRRIGLAAWHAKPRHPYLIPYYPSWKEKKRGRGEWKKKKKDSRSGSRSIPSTCAFKAGACDTTIKIHTIDHFRARRAI